MTTAVHVDVQLAEFVKQYRYDPLGFVLTCFPWGEGALKDFDGPDKWQREFLEDLGKHIRDRGFDGHTPVRPIKMSVGSGRGIGKSALCAMLTCFILSTRPGCRITITSNTFNQLSTKTWAECQTWIKRCVTSHWFESTGERIYRIGEKEAWFAAAITCSEENSQSFAGQHAATSSSVYIFDESSTIPDIIAEVALSGLTTGEPMFFTFGNVTETKGFFYRSLFGSDTGKYDHRSIDSRDCAFPNKETNDEAIAEYGEDSDYCRVWIRGLAPRASTAQYISDDLVKEAQSRPHVQVMPDEPLVCGVDFAWGGDDYNTVRFRRGLDARTIPPIRIAGEFTRKPEAMIGVLSEVLSKDYLGRRVDMMFMDSAGIAGPVAVRLKQLGFKNIMECNFSAQSVNPKYRNVRSQIYGECKEWLIAGGRIDRSVELSEDLQSQEVKKHVPLLLKPKDELIKDLGRSPDDSDALCFLGDTLISTPEGKREIRDLSYGDEVLTPMGPRKILRVHRSKADRLTTVCFSNGSRLTGKPEHTVFTWDSGFIELDALSLTNAIETDSLWRRWQWQILNSWCTWDRSFGFKAAAGILVRARTRLTRRDFFTVGSGQTFMDRFLKEWKSIIRMAIGGITSRQIWKFAALANISGSTCWNDALLQKATPRPLLQWSMPESKHRNGMDLPKGSSGIDIMELNAGKTDLLSMQFVSGAGSYTKHISNRGRNIARELAPKRWDIAGISRRFGTVFSAIKNSARTAIATRNVVPVDVLSRSVIPVETFNLTVEGENVYYANGILVANCLTFYMPVVSRQVTQTRGSRGYVRETITEWS